MAVAIVTAVFFTVVVMVCIDRIARLLGDFIIRK